MSNKDNRYNAECYLVSFGFDENNTIKVALVGKRNSKGANDVVNAFSGEDAVALYNKLTSQNSKG